MHGCHNINLNTMRMAT